MEMFHELQELLGAYLMPVLIAVPLAVIVLIAAFKRDDYRTPRDYMPPRPPVPPRPAEPPVLTTPLPPLPGLPNAGPSMASAFVTAPTPMLPPAPPTPPVPEGPPTILIADDSAVVRTKLKRLFE